MQAIFGLIELVTVAMALIAAAYFGCMWIVLGVGLLYRRVRYGKGNW
jgi:hypothetical protein